MIVENDMTPSPIFLLPVLTSFGVTGVLCLEGHRNSIEGHGGFRKDSSPSRVFNVKIVHNP